MRLQLRSQRHRWSLLFAQCGVVLLCVAAMTGCAAVGTQSDTTAQSAPTITTTPPPITNDAPTHQPNFAGGFAAIKPHLAGTPSFSADDMKQYVSAHAIVGPDIVGPDRGSGQPVVVLANFLSCAEIDQQVGGGVARTLNGCGEGARFGLVIESGGFAFAGSGGGAHLTAPKAFMVFDPTSGNLLMYGSLTDQSNTPTPQPGQPTPTTQPGKPTPTTAPHIALTMKPLSAEQSCGSSSTTKLVPITLTLDAAGSNVAVSWNATIGDKIGASNTVWATVSPSSGTIPAGHTAQITVTPASNICTLSQSIVPDATYHLVAHYGSGSALTFSDLVHSPIPG